MHDGDGKSEKIINSLSIGFVCVVLILDCTHLSVKKAH